MKLPNAKSVLSVFIALALSVTPYGAPTAQETVATVEHDVLGLGGITPVGQWEADNKESRYDVTLCGDGTQLCAELVWIRPKDINRRNKQYLNTYVVYEAERSRPAEWRGDINVYGTTYSGSVKIINQNKLLLTGCLFILCETFELNRRKNPDGSRV